MQCSSNCPCQQSQKTPFYCHDSGDPFTCDYRVPLGHTGSVRVFDISNPNILGVGIEQAVVGGGPRIQTDAAGKCRIVCIKNKKTWYSYKDVKRCCNCEMLEYRPWLLTPHGDCEIVLPGGCYRFVVYDCDYGLIVPEPSDIAMLLTVEKC